MTDSKLIEIAKNACEKSYSPYSHFKVGSALLCKDGSVFTGCNVENASFGATNCAERTAIYSAIAHGKREFLKIAVVGTSNDSFENFTPPCGICRQVMNEFCTKDFKVILYNGKTIKSLTLDDLMPYPFSDF